MPAGEKVILKVDTGQAYAGVVYMAYYDDGEKTGAAPPWGDGYGGNSGGPSDEEGVYTDVFVVRADTPPGPARVDVNILYNSEGGSQKLTLPFTVKSPTGGQGTPC